MTSLGSIALKVLDAPLKSGAPVLAKRKSVVAKVDDAKREEKEAAELARARRAAQTSAHQSLRARGASSESGAAAAAAAAAAAVAAAGGADVARQTTGDPVLETRLRRLATRGVVTLFNAVHEAQKRPAEEADRKKATKRKREKAAAAADGADAPPLTKDSFLDILRRGSAAAAAPAPAASALPGSRFLHDDFMMGRGRMRDFDHELDEDVEDGGGFGGGLDDVDD